MASEFVFVLSCPPDAATQLDIEFCRRRAIAMLFTSVFRLDNLKREHNACVAGEFEAGQRRRHPIDIFRKRQNLESPAEHFGMQQCLQGALRFRILWQRSQSGDYSGDEIMLIGKTVDLQAARFSALD